MLSLPSILSFTHLIGLAWAIGAATLKLVLLWRCRTDPRFIAVYLQVVRPVTRHIVIGLILLTASGIGWLAIGYPFTTRLGVKLFMVAAVWVLGPVIDTRAEPKFRALAPAPGEPPSAAFLGAQRQYLALEIVADAILYGILVVWVLV